MLSQSSFATKNQNFYTLLLFTLLINLSVHELIKPNIKAINNFQEIYRQLVKIQNLKLIQKFNSDSAHGFQLKPNNFLKLKNDQFHKMFTAAAKLKDTAIHVSSNASVSSSKQSSLKRLSVQFSNQKFQLLKCESINIDLSIYASSVKQQGQCNSCYAHSAIATVESLMQVQYGGVWDLSQQQIAECTKDYAPKGLQIVNNLGCDGGWGWKTLLYIKQYGVVQEKDYPYTLAKNTFVKQCQQTKISGERFKIADFKKYYDDIWPQTQCSILNQVLKEKKTVAVSIYVPPGIQFQFYGSARPKELKIWNICGHHKGVNHQVQLVGSTDRYWKVKNSFGKEWGQNGYLYLDKSKGQNCLNICMEFAFPTGLRQLKQNEKQQN